MKRQGQDRRNWGPRMIARAALLAVGMTTPALADLPQDAGALLSAPETELQGAIVACAAGAFDPAAAGSAFQAAGWQPVEDYDGSTGWEQGDRWVSYWNDPGFCMLADEGIGTAAMEQALLELLASRPATGTDEFGCTTYDLGRVTATLTSSGNDPTCTSSAGAALRFQPTGQDGPSGP